MKLLRKAWHLAEYGVARAAFTLVGLIPVRLVVACADVAAAVAYLVLARRRRIAVDNILRAGIKLGFPKPNARRHYCSAAKEYTTLPKKALR